MPGLEKLLRGVLKYHKTVQPGMVHQFKAISDHPDPKALVFSCVDSRVLTTRLLQTEVGDTFIVRNAGNFVPHASTITERAVSTEPAVLELACVINNIQNIIVCGHSDCKAMNTLFDMRDNLDQQDDSPLRQWLRRHGAASISKYAKMEAQGTDKPLEYTAGSTKRFEAYIDPDNNFNMKDKLSQVNTLQQLYNIATYPFMVPKIREYINLHAMWFDIYSGDFYLFSQTAKRFMVINEENFDFLLKDMTTRVHITEK